jgi:hypothetical protein
LNNHSFIEFSQKSSKMVHDSGRLCYQVSDFKRVISEDETVAWSGEATPHCATSRASAAVD